MSLEAVKSYLEKEGILDRLKVFDTSSATVELAAQALGCEPAWIAKTMSFLTNSGAILIVTAGDVKVDNKKFKEQFHQKAKMIPGDLVESYIGHAPGGVCPFAIPENVPVYMDVSLKRFEKVYPAGGDAHSAVELTIAELEKYAHATSWVDVCKEKEPV